MFELESPKDDGLFIASVGEWSHDKHYFFMRYVDAFTTAMKNKKWGGLHYIDLFAGAGIERLEDSQRLEWGSPLIAAQSPYPFDGIHVCEKDREKCDALKTRIQKIVPSAQVLCGDANQEVDVIVDQIPTNALSLAFLDPFGLHLDYETLRKPAARRADLIIFFPDHLDALRNWEHNYIDKPDSNLDRCLGQGSDWRSIIDTTPRHRLAEVLRKLYVQQIEVLGYEYFDYERISMRNHPLYILIFRTRHEVGAKIWRGISGIKPDGQRTFTFPQD